MSWEPWPYVHAAAFISSVAMQTSRRSCFSVSGLEDGRRESLVIIWGFKVEPAVNVFVRAGANVSALFSMVLTIEVVRVLGT